MTCMSRKFAIMISNWWTFWFQTTITLDWTTERTYDMPMVHVEPIVCKVADFSRAVCGQCKQPLFATWHPITSSVVQLPTWHPKVSITSYPSRNESNQHICTFTMVFFMLINPDFNYPFKLELRKPAGSSWVSWRDVNTKKFLTKEKQSYGQKYEIKQATDWFLRVLDNSLVLYHHACLKRAIYNSIY